MPLDRLFHPRAGHSEKVGNLTDLEFRVWWTYELAADDYGVMLGSAVTLQAANHALIKHSRGIIERAFQSLIDVGLIADFEHQGQRYVCQLDWQDFQHVKYPRDSHLPLPPSEILERCSKATQELMSGRVSTGLEKDVEKILARGLLSALGLSGSVTRQYRLGNSYCDLLFSTEAFDILVEIKRWALHATALDQIVRYVADYKREAGRPVLAVLIGQGLGSISLDDAARHDVTVVTHDGSMRCSVICQSALWHFASSFAVNLPDTYLSESLTRAGGRETANGLRQEATGKRQTANELRERFDAFWATYPKKIGKDAAWRAWQKRRPDADLGVAILTAVERHKSWPQWLKDDGQYIPNPATWINQGRWQDEPTEAPKPTQGNRECPHDPRCETRHICIDRILADARKTRAS